MPEKCDSVIRTPNIYISFARNDVEGDNEGLSRFAEMHEMAFQKRKNIYKRFT